MTELLKSIERILNDVHLISKKEKRKKNNNRCFRRKENFTFNRAQLIFRTALLEPELELKIVRNMKKPPVPPKPTSFLKDNRIRSTLSEINQNNDLSFIDNDSNMNSLNTRRLGKIVKITLVKGKYIYLMI